MLWFSGGTSIIISYEEEKSVKREGTRRYKECDSPLYTDNNVEEMVKIKQIIQYIESLHCMLPFGFFHFNSAFILTDDLQIL